jgi:hypothetical protein
MAHRRWWIICGLVLLVSAVPTLKAVPPAGDAQALAVRIDQLVAAGWAKARAEPAPLAEDAEFLRRVYLDLIGRIPTVREARDFLADTAPDKRARLVDRLLDSHGYVNHFLNVWRDLLVPEVNSSLQLRVQAAGFDAWLRKQLTDNIPYDVMVRELLTAPLQVQPGRPAALAASGEPSPLAFYTAKEVKPENLAAATSRLFLGIKLECAQCHNHPFAEWKRDQFWSFAAFFAGLQRQGPPNFPIPGRERVDLRELTIPGTPKTVQASFLDGAKPQWKARVGARVTLAEWLTSADNPYFARAAVNRTWGYFFGTGLIDPVDDMAGGETTCSHPELLDELARAFAVHRFDVKFLIRAITASKAYQLTSASTHKSQDDPRLFARMAIKGLTGGQLYDSLATATGWEPMGPGNPRANPLAVNGPREQFLARFNNTGDKVTGAQTSILHALTLMNGRLTGDATHLERSVTLTAVLDAPFLDTPGRVETLYLAALARQPTARETERVAKFLDAALASAETKADRDQKYKQALADVFWALLNSGEFFLNH